MKVIHLKTTKLALSIIVTVITQFAYAQSVIRVSGAMSNIMMKGNLSSYVNLDTLKKEKLYGLGPVAGLKGEIMIVDGKVYASTVVAGKIVNTTNSISEVAMLVYVNTKDWQEVDTTTTLNSYEELEAFIEQLAKQNGYSLSEPFAFRIEATAPSINYHIIDWKKDVLHTMSNHKQFAISQSPRNAEVELLGFYSDHHHSIFTHHSSNMHVHVRNKKENVIGHLDNIKIKGELTIFLSK